MRKSAALAAWILWAGSSLQNPDSGRFAEYPYSAGGAYVSREACVRALESYDKVRMLDAWGRDHGGIDREAAKAWSWSFAKGGDPFDAIMLEWKCLPEGTHP
jgi:hypothetical protein